jgi:hypothetical protein
MNIGSLIHECLAVAVKEGRKAAREYIDGLDKNIAKFTSTSKDYSRIRGTLRGVTIAFPYYREMQKADRIEDEEYFELPVLVPTTGFFHLKKRTKVLHGFIDLTRQNGSKSIITEYKTVSRHEYMLGSVKLDTDLQIRMYHYAARCMFGKNADLEWITIKRPLLRIHKNELPEEFEDRIIKDYTEKPEKYFNREIIQSKETPEEFEGYILDVIRRLERDRVEGFVKNFTQCNLLSECFYAPICTNQPGWQGLYEIKEQINGEKPRL